MRKTLAALLLLCFFSFPSLATDELNGDTATQRVLLVPEISVAFPDAIQVSGIVIGSKKGMCGKKCTGGYIKIQLQQKAEGYDFKNIYVVTACQEIKVGKKVNYIVVQLKGDETECFYKKYYRPNKQMNQPIYRILQVNPS